MAKKGIHPEYHEVDIEIFAQDGSKKHFKSFSTFNGNNIVAEVNIYKHPAWKDSSKIDAENSVNKIMQKFTKKYNYKVKE